jgi:hypothetical protein
MTTQQPPSEPVLVVVDPPSNNNNDDGDDEKVDYDIPMEANDDENSLGAKDSLRLAENGESSSSSPMDAVFLPRSNKGRRISIAVLATFAIALVVILATTLSTNDNKTSNVAPAAGIEEVEEEVEEVEEVENVLQASYMWSDAGACDDPTPFQNVTEIVTEFSACSSTSECNVGEGECCLQHYCFCKAPNLDINEACVPDP